MKRCCLQWRLYMGQRGWRPQLKTCPRRSPANVMLCLNNMRLWIIAAPISNGCHPIGPQTKIDYTEPLLDVAKNLYHSIPNYTYAVFIFWGKTSQLQQCSQWAKDMRCAVLLRGVLYC